MHTSYAVIVVIVLAIGGVTDAGYWIIYSFLGISNSEHILMETTNITNTKYTHIFIHSRSHSCSFLVFISFSFFLFK
jgi:hypothetical protein